MVVRQSEEPEHVFRLDGEAFDAEIDHVLLKIVPVFGQPQLASADFEGDLQETGDAQQELVVFVLRSGRSPSSTTWRAVRWPTGTRAYPGGASSADELLKFLAGHRGIPILGVPDGSFG